jgi:pimeloyl-ACP methyl ester carboxylesterase
MATVVLVPGAFCGGWAWKKVIPLLRAAGHDVYATTGTGLGDRVHLASPSVDLDTHIMDVVNVLEFEELTEVTLVGWSYGGTIITGVAERVPERLAQLVYLDASVPADGENHYDTWGASDEVRAADRTAAEAAGHPGFFGVPTGDFADLIRSWIPDPADQAWFFSKLTPHPIATYSQPLRLGNPRAAALPRAFILCTEGKAATDYLVRTATQLRSAPGWRYRQLADTHDAPVNVPQETADVLLSLILPTADG